MGRFNVSSSAQCSSDEQVTQVRHHPSLPFIPPPIGYTFTLRSLANASMHHITFPYIRTYVHIYISTYLHIYIGTDLRRTTAHHDHLEHQDRQLPHLPPPRPHRLLQLRQARWLPRAGDGHRREGPAVEVHLRRPRSTKGRQAPDCLPKGLRLG